MGHDFIVFEEEGIYITKYNRSEDKWVVEWNEQDDEYDTAYTRDNADGGIEELEYDEVVGTPTNNYGNNNNGQNII